MDGFERTLAHPRINRALPEYTTAIEHLQQTHHALARTLTILRNKNNSLEAYQESLLELSTHFNNFAAATRQLTDAQRRNAAASPPGAFRVSAAEAAAQGIYPAVDRHHIAPIETEEISFPEACAIPLDGAAAIRLSAIQRTLRQPTPVVQAEVPMMMVHGIPVAEATVVHSSDALSSLRDEESN